MGRKCAFPARRALSVGTRTSARPRVEASVLLLCRRASSVGPSPAGSFEASRTSDGQRRCVRMSRFDRLVYT